ADETVVLTLQNPGAGSSIGGPSTHTLTILNDDGAAPTVAFATATGSIAEGNSGTSTYTATATLSNPGSLTFPITVPVAVVATGTTATIPTDYTLATTTLTFGSAAALSQPINVTIVGDLLPEPNETVVLRLGTPSNASLIVGTPGTHTLTILNDDAPPAGATCAAPYFSRYFESATGNTKVLEIFNPTTSPRNLSGLRVELFAANATTPTATAILAGSLASGRVYVIANTGVTDAGVKALANFESNVCFFSGPQSVVLFDGTDTLDIIGVVGRTPSGTGWAVPSGTTRDNSLVRLPATGRGNSRWFGPTGAALTWQAQGTDNFTGLGSYVSSACTTPLAVRGGHAAGTLELYPNPATGRVSVRLPGATPRSATVEVLDALGRTVRQLSTTLGDAAPAAVELSGLPAGLYAVRVHTADGQYLGRIVVE
ncbi:MAG: T9SS type A sorting domain-containing protein, partial [Hymenobacter sp.]